MLLPLAACGAPQPAASQVTVETKETETAEIKTTEQPPEPEPEPEFYNCLTGLPCDEKLVGKRPIAVMINNLKVSLPQSGLNKCDIIYEVEAEGGILRLEGIMLDYEHSGRLGTTRSARPYYVEISMAYDAVFVHAGGSDMGYDWIRKYNVDDVDGVRRGPFNVNGVGIFWRDQARLNSGVPLEHTMFTSGENVALAIADRGYRTTLNDPNFTAFHFAKEFKKMGTGKSAVSITIPHSKYSVSEFSYNATDKKYYHSQYGAPHIDAEDKKQIATENVFILYAPSATYPGQAYRKIDIVGEGQGYYCSGGEYKSIIWRRDNATGTFSYFNENGTLLEVNPGRSYVAIANKSIYNDTVIN